MFFYRNVTTFCTTKAQQININGIKTDYATFPLPPPPQKNKQTRQIKNPMLIKADG